MLLPQPAWNNIVASTARTHMPRSHLRRREPMPAPTNVKPPTGKNTAYQIAEGCRRDVVVTGRAVVDMVRVELAGLVLVMVTLVVENEQLAPDGSPLEQDRETALG